MEGLDSQESAWVIDDRVCSGTTPAYGCDGERDLDYKVGKCTMQKRARYPTVLAAVTVVQHGLT